MGEKCIWTVSLLFPLLSTLYILSTCHWELSSTQALKTFGEDCDGDCDERQLLTCSQNTSICECMLPSSMVYDRTRSKCVGRAGYPCLRYASDYHCAPHASCDRAASSTLCKCDQGYFENDNGTCLIMAKYGESCSSRKPCDRKVAMHCTEKSPGSGGGTSSKTKRTCQCMYPSDQYYNSSAKSCITYAGGNCSFSWPCVRNAECSVDIYELRRGENMHGKMYTYNATVGRRCACKAGFRETKDHQCLPSYRQQCDLESEEGECNTEESLKCFDSSICMCKSPLSQIYDWNAAKCVLLVGAKCISASGNQGGGERGGGNDESADDVVECTSNAECGVSSGRCECKEKFSVTPFSTCLKDFGEECSSRDRDNLKCNIFRGLHCTHPRRTCGCIDDDTLKYDTNTKTCLSGEEGGPCGVFEYSEEIGFVLGGGDDSSGDSGEVVMMTTMGNRKGGVMVVGGKTLGSNNSSSSSVTATAINERKVFAKIHIKCGSGLECRDAFGEMSNGKGDNGIFQGFCHLTN